MSDKIEPTFLAKRNAHPRDEFITFDEGPHIYTVHGEQGYTSVTTWNHSHFAEFDKDAILDGIFKKKKNEDPNYKYYNMSREQIEEIWEKNRIEASGAGTKTHYNIECFYNNIEVDDDSIEYKYFKNFRNDHLHLEAYRTEWCVYHEELKLSGSIDMVFQDTNTGDFMIYDWKRSKEISFENRYGQTAKTKCIRHMEDCNYSHYSLQLNVYRRILQEKYDMKITKLALVVLHPDNPYENYEVIDVPMLDKEIEDLWVYRKSQLEESK
jgi:ATP-dependent exoDNAse (exonuclease V) beta subunit